jgi:SAM-dependent methyltransferase
VKRGRAVWAEVRAEAQARIDTALAERVDIRVLEAGCGSAGHIRFPRGTSVTGIDLSSKQLARNPIVEEKIVGDVQFHPLEAEAFDLVICWDVLEHLDRPDLALVNFARTLKRGGVLVLAFPNGESLKGLAAKLTPFRFHVWLYRHVIGSKNAGTEDVGPFPTYFRAGMRVARVESVAVEHGLRLVYRRLYESLMQEEVRFKLGVTGRRWEAVRRGVRALSGGRLSAHLTDCVLVFQKN